MTEKSEVMIITDPNNVPVTFVNQVVASGHLNAVVNITLSVARFSPNNGGTVDADLVIASRLRMDIACAMQLRDQLDRIIKQVESGAKQALATALVTTAEPGPSGKAS